MVGHGDRGLAHAQARSEEHTSELQSQSNLVCRLLLEKKKKKKKCLSFTYIFKIHSIECPYQKFSSSKHNTANTAQINHLPQPYHITNDTSTDSARSYT